MHPRQLLVRRVDRREPLVEEHARRGWARGRREHGDAQSRVVEHRVDQHFKVCEPEGESLGIVDVSPGGGDD